jgi:hypothetical protein
MDAIALLYSVGGILESLSMTVVCERPLWILMLGEVTSIGLD